MKNILFICSAILALTYTTAVKADEGFYAGAFGGANWLDISSHVEMKTGFLVGGSIGCKWCNGLRVEGELGYRRNKLNHFKVDHEKLALSGHVRTWSYMANAFYELPIDFCLKPYVGAGVGYANQRANMNRINEDRVHAKNNKNGFAYQLIAGVAYPICDTIDLDLEYRYFRGREHTNNNSVALGMKYMF